ncbi:membrane protein insertion efficiency factor YidD [bacterium]|nr:membrane protein insertion efficiency factor YidD [bacterium]
MSDFPSKEERELVRKYVLERPLYRPNITYLKAFGIVSCAICCIVIGAVAGFSILSSFGFYLKKWNYFTVFFLVSFAVCARWFAILAVKLYQHYASEEIRRRCLLKPTCSEYAIIVLKKYGFLIGTIKISYRLICKCRGNVYYIDEP